MFEEFFFIYFKIIEGKQIKI